MISEGDDWILGLKCKGFESTGVSTFGPKLVTVFEGNLVQGFDTAKKDCAAACNMRDDCNYASLFWRTTGSTALQSCNLHSNEYCKEFEDHYFMRLYVKQ